VAREAVLFSDLKYWRRIFLHEFPGNVKLNPMPIVRILVDGFSLLHAWPELAPGKARFSAAAREELIRWLRLYGDAIGTPITVVFDGRGPVASVGQESLSTPEMEIIYSKSGQTADDIIERVTAKLVNFGEVLVISDDFAEKDTVRSVGGRTASCAYFIQDIRFTLSEFQKQLEKHNKNESRRFKNR
jgi:predicted RNA-binding protein with PIN domain